MGTINQRATDNFPTIVIDKSTILPFFQAVSNGVGSLDQIATNGIWHIIDQVLIPTTPVKQTLNQLITSKPDLSTFATALKAGRLTGALDGQNGQLTVFAPSNQAFAKLPKATLEHLLDPKNIDELQSILEYHVIGNIELRTGCKRNVYGACDGNNDLENLSFVFTLQSNSVNVDTQKNGDIFLSPDVFYKPNPKISKIVQTNLGATNGIVHIINQVLIPPAPTRTIFEAVEASGAHATFIAALKAAGLEKQLQDTTHGQYYTAFVPSEEAFAKLSKATLDHLLDPKNVKELRKSFRPTSKVMQYCVLDVRRLEGHAMIYSVVLYPIWRPIRASMNSKSHRGSQGMLLSTRPGWYHSAPVHMMGLVDSITLLPMVSGMLLTRC